MTAALQESPSNLAQMISSFQYLSVADRLILAKALLDSLQRDDFNGVKQSHEVLEPLSLDGVVKQIKSTPANPQQIQRATCTVDEVLENWDETPDFEPRLTNAEWEQSWWSVREETKQRDRQKQPII